MWNCGWCESIPVPGWCMSSITSGSPPLSEQLLRAKTKPIDTHLAFTLVISLTFGIVDNHLARVYNFFLCLLLLRSRPVPSLPSLARVCKFWIRHDDRYNFNCQRNTLSVKNLTLSVTTRESRAKDRIK